MIILSLWGVMWKGEEILWKHSWQKTHITFSIHFLSLSGKTWMCFGCQIENWNFDFFLNPSFFQTQSSGDPYSFIKYRGWPEKKCFKPNPYKSDHLHPNSDFPLFFSRQGVPSDRSVVVRNNKMNSVLGHYRSYGWVSATSAADAKKKAADIKFMRKAQQKAWMRLGTRANKLQKYWRDPTLQWS